MSRPLRFSFLFLALVCCLFVPREAEARVLLKPNGRAALPLRTKMLRVRTMLTGQFARTRTETTFQNEFSQRIEADFLYTVPDGTVVTYFAYWFGQEKVVARVVEKERAAEIYRHITTRQRDPALVEMLDKNTFRARIFPIEPNADLKVEIHTVQMLPSDAQGVLYELPLKDAATAKSNLDQLDVEVAIDRSVEALEIINNYKLPVQEGHSTGARLISLKRQNYHAPLDLRVRLKRPARALHATLYSAASGGPDGFFALALTPGQNLNEPRLQISGARTYDVLPRRLPSLKAHQSVLVVGRYRGSGMAKIALTGYTPAGLAVREVSFERRREDNNLATKLWAAEMIEQLSQNAGNRGRVVELSKRYTLPSKWTSWLAVPKAEMELYRQEKARLEMETYGRQLADAIADNKGHTRAARQLRRRFNEKARFLGEDPSQALSEYLQGDLQSTAYEIVSEKQRSKPSPARLRTLQRKFDRLARAAGGANNSAVRYARSIVLNTELEAVAQQWAREVAQGRNGSARARRLRRQSEQLNKALGSNGQQQVEYAFQREMADIARLWVQEKSKAKSNPAYLNTLERRLQQLAPVARQPAEAVRSNAAFEKLHGELTKLAEPLAQEIREGRAADTRARQLRGQAAKMGHRLNVNAAQRLDTLTRELLSTHVHSLSREFIEHQHTQKSDAKRLRELRQQLERIATATGTTTQTLLQPAQADWLRYAPYRLARELVEEQADPESDPTRVQFLKKQLEEAVAQRRASREFSYDREYDTVENHLSNAQYDKWSGTIGDLNAKIAAEKSLATPDAARLAQLAQERQAILHGLTPTAQKRLKGTSTYPAATLWGLRDLLFEEYRKARPDSKRIAELKKNFIAQQHNDWYYSDSRYGGGRKPTDPRAYGRLRAERLRLQAELEKLDEDIKEASAPQAKPLQEERVRLAQQHEELRVRMGDPLIAVEAPADAVQVIALMPGGEVKKLVYDPDTRRWEARFDVPTHAEEGEYSVTVIIVNRDGTRRQLVFRYHVDTTPPAAIGAARTVAADKATLRLELDVSEDTARVAALLPWGEKIEMNRSTLHTHRFFALAPVPQAHREVTAVTFLITDQAHNRTSLTVDVSQ